MSATGEIAESRLQRFLSSIRGGVVLFFRAPLSPRRRPAWPPRGWLVFGAVTSIMIVGLAVVALDARSAATARALPPLVIEPFRTITDFGLSGWFLFPAAALLLLLAALDRPGLPDFSRGVLATIAMRAGFVFMAVAVPGLFAAIVKRLIGRARPFVAGEDPWTTLWFVWRPEYASFPSGHATTAFAAATAIGALWPLLRPWMWTYAVIIAISRVMVTAHHPSDVIAGAITGTIGALLVRNWYATRRLGFVVGADGSVKRLPGPSWSRVKTVARRLLPA